MAAKTFSFPGASTQMSTAAGATTRHLWRARENDQRVRRSSCGVHRQRSL